MSLDPAKRERNLYQFIILQNEQLKKSTMNQEVINRADAALCWDTMQDEFVYHNNGYRVGWKIPLSTSHPFIHRRHRLLQRS